MMKRRNIYVVALLAGLFIHTSCEKDFFIDLDSAPVQLVVEAYINNEEVVGNYVILTYSQNYYDTGFQGIPATGATVSITEGILDGDGTYQWDASTKKQLHEGNVPSVPGGTVPGLYIDTSGFNNAPTALMGKPGKSYLLEIDIKGSKYTSVTSLPQPVILDSVTPGNYFFDSIYQKARLTLHYKDPDTIGNTQLYYWKNNFNHSKSFGWGSYGSNRFLPRTDDLTNGQYMQVTPNNGFPIGDTVHYYLVSVERRVHEFWDSYYKARDNAGPFATPVKLKSNIMGENVVGCFSGFSISAKTLIVN